jgi:hypothetical protein
MIRSRRSLTLALVALGPMALALALRAVSSGPMAASLWFNGRRVEGRTVAAAAIGSLYLRIIVPALGIFFGTALIADEVEDRTITYLWVRPVRRAAVLLGKYAAYLAVAALLMVPAAIGQPAAAPALFLGLAAYGAVFAFVGARLSRPQVAGLLFAFGWEPVALLAPGDLQYLTVAYYVRTLTPVHVGILAAITAAALCAAAYAVEHREYVIQ